MSIFPNDAGNCLIKAVNRKSTNANNVYLIQALEAQVVAEGFVSAELYGCVVFWPCHKTIFSCNMHIF